MRRAVRAGLLGAVVALAPGTPASAQQASYRTQTLPAAGPTVSAASAGGKRTERITLKSSKRFSLAALRWPGGTRLEGRLRAKRTDGRWTSWSRFESERPGLDGAAETGPHAKAAAKRVGAKAARESTTEPTWTGPARTLQIELTGKRPRGLRAAFVDVTGRAAAPVRAARRTTDAYAGIQPRASWDPNNECAPRASASIGSVQGVVVHHTAGSNNYTATEVPAVLLAICKYHRNGNGWNDVGYNVLVDRYGGAWEGRAGGLAAAVIGAHAQGFNAVTAGVSILGDFTSQAPPPAALATAARVSAWKLAVAGAPRSGSVALTSAGGSASRYNAGVTATVPRIMGHRDVGQTACPGNTAYPMLDGLRAQAATLDPALPVNLPAPIAPVVTPVKIGLVTARRVRGGAATRVRGTIKQGSDPLRGVPLGLQVRTGGNDWATVETTKSDTKGHYRFSRRFSRTWETRVVRTDGGDGDPSRVVNIVMVAQLSLKVPKRFSARRELEITGRITPGRGPVILQMERRSPSGRWVKSDEEEVTMKGRTLRVTVTPPSATLYRFRFVYRGSDLTAKARSPLVHARGV